MDGTTPGNLIHCLLNRSWFALWVISKPPEAFSDFSVIRNYFLIRLNHSVILCDLPYFRCLWASVWDLAPPAALSDPTHDPSPPAASAAPHTQVCSSAPSHPAQRWTSAANNTTLNTHDQQKANICAGDAPDDTSTLYWRLFTLWLIDAAYSFLCTVRINQSSVLELKLCHGSSDPTGTSTYGKLT